MKRGSGARLTPGSLAVNIMMWEISSHAIRIGVLVMQVGSATVAQGGSSHRLNPEMSCIEDSSVTLDPVARSLLTFGVSPERTGRQTEAAMIIAQGGQKRIATTRGKVRTPIRPHDKAKRTTRKGVKLSRRHRELSSIRGA